MLDTITEELGATTVFESLQREPLASASIGQVHAATVAGAEVVVKVRRPGVVETINRDLEFLENLAEQATRRWDAAGNHDVVGLTQEFGRTLRNELDYLREGHNAERFAANASRRPQTREPRPSTRRRA